MTNTQTYYNIEFVISVQNFIEKSVVKSIPPPIHKTHSWHAMDISCGILVMLELLEAPASVFDQALMMPLTIKILKKKATLLHQNCKHYSLSVEEWQQKF